MSSAPCHVCGVSSDYLFSTSRARRLTLARTLAALLVKETPHLTLVEASRFLRRDVSSLSHSLARLHERFIWDREARDQARKVRRRLNTIQRRRAQEQKAEA